MRCQSRSGVSGPASSEQRRVAVRADLAEGVDRRLFLAALLEGHGELLFAVREVVIQRAGPSAGVLQDLVQPGELERAIYAPRGCRPRLISRSFRRPQKGLPLSRPGVPAPC